ncbi:MAG: VCBS repeat-containing protein [Cyclobacteriaceae bacterium]
MKIHWPLPALFIFIICFCLNSCGQDDEGGFALLSPEDTQVSFVNQIDGSDTFNLMTYYYLYNGAGVAAADLNNDGLDDLVFAGNMVPSRVYLNRGDMQFEDITERAGFNVQKWVMGVSVMDINADGWNDIYLSVGGPGCPEACRNLLYVNQGTCHDGLVCFEEQAQEYGLADSSYSVQATFLDYDRDGDLDLFLLTNVINNLNKSFIVDRRLKVNKGENVDKLFENRFDETLGHPVFTDVSQQAGIEHEGYGLGVAIDDINADGWPDIYVGNDFMDNDYLYINQQDGTFQDEADYYFRHQSMNSMGVDVADINNDLRPDIAVLDMLPPDNYRQKMMLTPLKEDTEIRRVESGYSHQYIRNTLHLNQGESGFSEIGQLAGVDATDWSWAVLMADFDHDGQRDMFISNGIVKDMTDLDFTVYQSSQAMFGREENKEEKIRQLAKDMKGAKTSNYLFRNHGDLTFTDQTDAWGVKIPSFSNGAAYSDLDNDGDLDLVTNNINDPAFIYENKLNANPKPFLKLKLSGAGQNPQGIGSRVYLYQGDQSQYSFFSPQKGYLSTVSHTLHFGLADTTRIDSLFIVWPDQQVQVLKDVNSFQTLTVSYAPNRSALPSPPKAVPPLRDASQEYQLTFQQEENHFNDFKDSPLLLRKYSSLGPGIAVGDVNGDGQEDFFVGGSVGQTATLFLQQDHHAFSETKFPYDSLIEDTGCLLFDKDNDGDLDLYVVSGGVEWGTNQKMYQDRLYENDGRGNFSKVEDALPEISSSGSYVVAADYDQDGDLDLFVGGRVRPVGFPLAPASYLLRNDQRNFTDVTQEVFEDASAFGMVSAALWTDYNQDGQADLLVAEEWGAVQLYLNEGGHFRRDRNDLMASGSGWWNSLYGSDLDRDGDIDYVLGNHGLNSRFRASEDEPIRLYAKDFDHNNEVDPIVTYTNAETEYVYHPRDAVLDQIVAMRKRFSSYNAYATAPLREVLMPAELDGAEVLEVNELRSALLMRQGEGTIFKPLPMALQFAPIMGVCPLPSEDATELMFVGNFYDSETALGPYDAFNGAVLRFEQEGGEPVQTLDIPGDARSLAALTLDDQQVFLVGRNQGTLMLCEQTNHPKGRFESLQPLDFYAEIRLDDGQTYREEFYYGAGYLSQSSRHLFVPEAAEEVVVYSFDGQQRVLTELRSAL